MEGPGHRALARFLEEDGHLVPVTIFTAFTTRERPAGVQEDEEEEDPDDNYDWFTLRQAVQVLGGEERRVLLVAC